MVPLQMEKTSREKTLSLKSVAYLLPASTPFAPTIKGIIAFVEDVRLLILILGILAYDPIAAKMCRRGMETH